MMKYLTRGVSLAVLTLFAALPARAETMQNAAAGIQFDLPTGWSADKEGDNAIRVKNADGSFEVVLAAADKDTVEDAAKDITDELGTYLKDIKADGEGKTGEFNGMPMWELTGTGTEEGEAVAWSVTIFAAKKPVLVLMYADPSVIKSPPADVATFAASIKKM
jgi:hypothetical protein